MSEQPIKPSMDDTIAAYIKEGKLVSADLEQLLEQIKMQFAEDPLVKDGQLTLELLRSKVENQVWDKKTTESLERVVKFDLPLTKFMTYHAFIPEAMVKAKAQELTGSSRIGASAPFLPGIGRLGTRDSLGISEEFEFPKSSFGNPFTISVVNDRQCAISFINGANVGLKHDRRIRNNPVRKALAEAERRRDTAVIVTNPINIDTKKAGGSAKVHRALVSGRNVNVRVLDPDYQERAKEILADPSSHEIIYETFREVFENIITGWQKITSLGGYSGNVFVVFGRNEEELIAAATYWELRYWTIRRQNELEVEIRLARNALARAKSNDELGEAAELEEKLQVLIKEKSRTVISDINTAVIEKTFNTIRAFVAKKFEEAIPNCQVIGHGTTFVKLGNEIIEIHIPDSTEVTDTLLARYADHYGPKVLRSQFANTVVICHPYALNYRMTVREVDRNGVRNSAMIHVAPIVVDGIFLRDALSNSIRRMHPLSKVVFSEQFSPGVLRITCDNGITSGDVVSVSALGAYKKVISKDEEKEKKPLIRYPDSPFIWIMVGTDPHWGSRAKEKIWCERQESNLGVAEAAIEMMRIGGLFREGAMPVHMFCVNDDPTQGNHYDTHKQPDPHEMTYADIEKALVRAKKNVLHGNVKNRKQAFDKLREFFLNQLLFKGLDWPQHQMMEVFSRHLHPNLDFFNAVLLKSVKSGLIVKGVSDFENSPYDGRDIGRINFGSGNHFNATVEDTLTEGFIYAGWLSGLLSATSEWKDKTEELFKLVKAPLHGNEHIGWGTIKMPNGYEWGLELRSSPAQLSSWGDTLLGAVRNDERRGNYSRVFNEKMTVKIYGDKHFFGAVATEHTFYHMCAAGTHTDLYGERGFPPNNTGISFVGLPSRGPNAGPILVRTLRFDFLRDYFAKPFEFDWKTFLPNPV